MEGAINEMTSEARSPDGVHSARTAALAAFAVAFSILAVAVALSGVTVRAVAYDLSLWVTLFVSCLYTLWSSMRLSTIDEASLGDQFGWFLVFLGLLILLAGVTVDIYYVVLRGLTPEYPGVADVLRIAAYPLLALGMTVAGFSFRKRVDVRQPLAVAALLTVLASAGLWFFVLRRLLFDGSVPLLARVSDAALPASEVLFRVGPLLFLSFVVFRPGLGARASGWRLAAISALALFASAAVVFWTRGHALPFERAFLAAADLARLVGFALLAVGASASLDAASAAEPEPEEDTQPFPIAGADAPPV
ncbi:MAG: hypothetical protein Kow0056_09370 [Coriobacteriia bacterium]